MFDRILNGNVLKIRFLNVFSKLPGKNYCDLSLVTFIKMMLVHGCFLKKLLHIFRISP